MASEEDLKVYIGKRLRRRRRLLGLTQTALAKSVGTRFQQIQKYECGANWVSVPRLIKLAAVLTVPIRYFYEEFDGSASSVTSRKNSGEPELHMEDILKQRDFIDLLRAFSSLNHNARQKVLEYAIGLQIKKNP